MPAPEPETTHSRSAKSTDSADFHHVNPILCVNDVSASIDYYVQVLGFTKRWDWPSDSDRKGFACVGRGKVQIFLCRQGQGHPGAWMWIAVGNVDQVYQEYKARGARIRQAPANFPWGSREMIVEDLDGNCLRLACDSTGPADGVPLADQG